MAWCPLSVPWFPSLANMVSLGLGVGWPRQFQVRMKLSLRPVVGITGYAGHLSRPWLAEHSPTGLETPEGRAPAISYPHLEEKGAPKTTSTTITPKGVASHQLDCSPLQ